MGDRRQNEFGATQFYDVKDKVKIWPIFKNPIGIVESIVDGNSFPIKYSVRYIYHDGSVYVDTFESTDLTLVEKYFSCHCNCETKSGFHDKWCNQSDFNYRR